jgi:sugar/nucleoside kinase (ribokinase family)
MQNSSSLIRFVLAGQLQRNTILRPDGQIQSDVPGGNLLYTAAGLGVWERGTAGLVARVGEDYPQEWLERAALRKFDVQGVHITPDPVDLRNFIGYDQDGQATDEYPISHFARRGLNLPRSLLGYTPVSKNVDSRNKSTPMTIQAADIPANYLDATAAHICAIDYLSHMALPPLLRHGNVSTITLDPASGYMNPIFWDDMPMLLNGINAVITTEEKISSLFQGRTNLLWEMLEGMAVFGPEIIIVQRSLGGHWMLNQSDHSRWIVPAYPNKMIDPTGVHDSFCGGFLAGYRRTYDPIQAALFGTVSASLTAEDSAPFYPLDAMPGLAQARFEAIKQMVKRA